MSEREIALGVVGLGYWGPHYLRTGSDMEGVRIVVACDPSDAARSRQSRRYRHVKFTPDFDELLADPDIDGVVLATPIGTHHDLARRALLAGKHVLVEKPMAATSEECRDLIEVARDRRLVLMPGHTFLYSPPVLAIKRMLDTGELGEISFATTTRVNLGIHRSDDSVIRDLGPHDFSILLFWLGKPAFVRAVGRDAVVDGLLDVAFLDVGYANGCLVRVELAWVAPTKLRRTVLVGREKMVVYDDTSSEQVRLYDMGVNVMEPRGFGEHQLSYRSGDILTPRLEVWEPLRMELQDFVDCIRNGSEPRSGAQLGLDVVHLVEASERSLEYNGVPVPVDPTEEERRREPDRRRTMLGRRRFPRRVRV
jgi:predicted dehydrogenase